MRVVSRLMDGHLAAEGVLLSDGKTARRSATVNDELLIGRNGPGTDALAGGGG